MTTISIKADIKEAQRAIDVVSKKQIPYASKLMLDALAESTKKRTETEIKRNLDRPTNYAQRMIGIKYANKASLTSQINVKGSVSRGEEKVLGHLFSGGKRHGKGFEGALVDKGIMPNGMYAMPGQGAPLDLYGNIKRSFINQLISYLTSFKVAKKSAQFENRQRKQVRGSTSAQYFIVNQKQKGGLPMGIWQRIGFGSGVSLRPIIIFVRKEPVYSRYFDLARLAQDTITKDARFEFDRAMAYAIATAK
jgi:hypothetical protein